MRARRATVVALLVMLFTAGLAAPGEAAPHRAGPVHWSESAAASGERGGDGLSRRSAKKSGDKAGKRAGKRAGKKAKPVRCGSTARAGHHPRKKGRKAHRRHRRAFCHATTNVSVGGQAPGMPVVAAHEQTLDTGVEAAWSFQLGTPTVVTGKRLATLYVHAGGTVSYANLTSEPIPEPDELAVDVLYPSDSAACSVAAQVDGLVDGLITTADHSASYCALKLGPADCDELPGQAEDSTAMPPGSSNVCPIGPGEFTTPAGDADPSSYWAFSFSGLSASLAAEAAEDFAAPVNYLEVLAENGEPLTPECYAARPVGWSQIPSQILASSAPLTQDCAAAYAWLDAA